MNPLENQQVEQSNPVLFLRIVISIINALGGVLIYVLLQLSHIRGGDSVCQYLAGVLFAILAITWFMWPSKVSNEDLQMLQAIAKYKQMRSEGYAENSFMEEQMVKYGVKHDK